MKSYTKQIEQAEKKLAELKRKQAEELEKTEWIKIPETDFEVEIKVHHKGKSYDELKKEFGEEYLNEHLLTLKLIGIICENQELFKILKMDSSSSKDDFFFKQPFPQNEKEGRVAVFDADSDGAYLDCYWDSDYSNSSRGVRFVRKISGGKK